MSLELTGRIAVVTGAASGIGREFARAAVSYGMKLALVDTNAAELAGLEDELPDCGIFRVLDVRDRVALDVFADEVKAMEGDIALVFANAGVMRAGTSWELPASDWDIVFDVNVKGVVNTASAFMPLLLGQEKASRIVITGSTSAFMARPHLSSYSASKHALWGIAEAMQLELAELKAPVGVSFLAPSGVKTPIASAPLHGPNADQQRSIAELLEAFGMPPEEVAAFTFDALQRECFWILPQPEFKDAVQLRVDNLTTEKAPAA